MNLQILSCVVQIASLRRTMFSNTERQTFIASLMQGIKLIFDNPQVQLLLLFIYLYPYFTALIQSNNISRILSSTRPSKGKLPTNRTNERSRISKTNAHDHRVHCHQFTSKQQQ
jgi:hypothetical protein